jgi:hypothetical protein
MSESKKLITKHKRLNTARQIVESVSEPANTAYYVFLGNHLDYANSTIMQPVDSVSETTVDIYKNMIYGKRVAANDIKLMIPRNDYEANKVYDMYDDQMGESNLALFNSNYYAVVNADAFYHVFKCLDNNSGSNSTVKPEFSEVDAQDEFYQTSDGYVWKYMYSTDSSTVGRFATTDFFPVVENTAVTAAASDGLINVIKVEHAGRGYDNYCNGVFRFTDLRIDSNPKKYSINSALTAPLIEQFFKDCFIYITSGTGMGQYAKIVDYQTNSTVKAITLLNEFAVAPAADSTFEITPGVQINGDGTQTSEAVARAIVNETSNSIQKIELLNLGGGYKFATASVLAHPSVSVANTALVRPIFSPPGGHGKDAAAELGSTRLCISTKFSNADIGIPVTNDYRTIGLLQDPIFANVVINYTSSTGTFLPTETVYSVSGVRISDTVVINTTSSIITSDADFVNQLSAGEYVYFSTTSGYQLAVVNSVTNSSYMTITSNGLYADDSASLYKTNMGSKLTSVDLTHTALTGNVSINTTSANIVGNGTAFLTELVGNSSQLFVYGNSSGGGVLKKVVSVADDTHATLESNGTFANATAKAQVINYTINSNTIAGVQSSSGIVTTVSAGSLRVSNVAGIFKTDDFIIGADSGATGVVTYVERNGVAKSFDTFIQMNKYIATPTAGSFNLDEIVFQSETGSFAEQYATAYMHSIIDNDSTIECYVTDQLGVFNLSNNIIGYSSEASADVTNKYSPELVPGSGKVLFIEKIDPINRTDTSTETIKFIFEF